MKPAIPRPFGIRPLWGADRCDRSVKGLFVAAGGGGDVMLASILQHKLSTSVHAPPFVATYSWDRSMVDPEPGPRGRASFSALEPRGSRNWLVSSATTMQGKGRSLLPRLAQELSTRFFLLDPYEGASGVQAQLRELVALLGVDIVYLVDSGGDILAHGDEPGLRSPLADALSLASTSDLGVDVEVLVTAAGLDGELCPTHVRETVRAIGGEVDWQRLSSDDVDWCRPLLSWHPSEVNGLLIAAARGFSGTVEIRDAALRVRVDATSPAVHRCTGASAINHNQLAKSVLGTSSLEDAQAELESYCGVSELTYQRRRHQTRHNGPLRSAPEDAIAQLSRYGDARRSDGLDALTLRRIAEVLSLDHDGLQELLPYLCNQYPSRVEPPIWLLR